MDQDATAAVAEAYHDNLDAARRWFEIMDEQSLRDGQQVDWDTFKADFKTAAEGEGYGSETVDYFLSTYLEQAVDADRRMGVIGQLADPANRDTVLHLFAERYPEVAGGAADEAHYDNGYEAGHDDAGQAGDHEAYAEQHEAEAVEEPFDEQAWLTFLTTEWAQSDKAWPAFGAQVAANAPDSYQEAVANFRQYVDAQPDQAEALAHYGLAGARVEAPPAETAAAETAETETAETDTPAAETEPETALREAVAEAQTALDKLIDENPELADLPEEVRQQALAEALEEFARAGG